jgi:hypothetical protein
MALLINKTVNILGDLEINQIYIRVKYSVDLPGTSVECNLFPYPSKEYWKNGPYLNDFVVIGIPRSVSFEYDSSTNGSDVLQFVHDSLKTYLSTDGYEYHPVRDPSSGLDQYPLTYEWLKDPSTGELITESVKVRDKFAQDSSISFIDLE